MGGGDGKIEETEYEKAQADVAVSRWNDYQQSFKQYENKFMDEVDQIDSPANTRRASELAISPLAQSFAQEAVQMNRGLHQNGVNPNSGKSLSANSAVGRYQADAEVDMSSRAVDTQKDNYVTGLSNVTAMGHGQAGQAMQGMTDIASMSQRDARSKAQDRMQDIDNVRSAVGAGVGAATAYGMKKDDGEG